MTCGRRFLASVVDLHERRPERGGFTERTVGDAWSHLASVQHGSHRLFRTAATAWDIRQSSAPGPPLRALTTPAAIPHRYSSNYRVGVDCLRRLQGEVIAWIALLIFARTLFLFKPCLMLSLTPYDLRKHGHWLPHPLIAFCRHSPTSAVSFLVLSYRCRFTLSGRRTFSLSTFRHHPRTTPPASRVTLFHAFPSLSPRPHHHDH